MQPRANASDAPRRAGTRNRQQSTKVIECLTCRERYSREDVLSGLYQITTKVCGECYSKMQASPHTVSCFGKTTAVQLDGTRLLGYDPDARECRELCPDAKLCASVADPGTYNPRE